MSFIGITSGISNAISLVGQGKELYDSFNQGSNSGSGDGNTIVNENHYHITKSKEEIELERQRLELAKEQASFNRATTRSQQAEDIKNKRKIVDILTNKGDDNTALYMLGGIIFLGFLVLMIKKK